MAEKKQRGLRVTDQEAELLAKPSVSLPNYAKLMDLEDSDLRLFDQDRVTYKLQQTLVSYFSDPSTIDESDRTYWLTVLKSRQTGSSNTCGLCLLPQVMYSTGLNAAVIADKQSRANEVYSRIELAYTHWPESIRTARMHSIESRALTTSINSKVVVLSAEPSDVGVGLSVDMLVGSELPLWSNAGAQMSAIYPSMINRKKAKMVLESTPQPLSAPSGQWWMDHYMDTLSGEGRHRGAFFPFWDSKANARPWKPGDVPTNDELRLLEQFGGTDQFGHPGLTLENLAFRREVMNTDRDIRRNPDLFNVWYPFDDQTCWISQGLGVVPAHAVDPHLRKKLYPEMGAYNEFPENWDGPGKPMYTVNPNAAYLIGVDPAGYGRDHHAFQVLEVWADEWIQVASYGARTDPNEFAQFLFDTGIRFNRAKIVIERTGVGHGPAMLLKHMDYPNLHYDDKGKPGVHKGNNEQWLELLVDSLTDILTLRGKDTALQVKGYRHDRMTEKTQRAELMHPGEYSGGRRERHHWDKVSALMVACTVAPRMPKRYRPSEVPDNIVPFDKLTWNQHQEYVKVVERMTQPTQKRPRYWRR